MKKEKFMMSTENRKMIKTGFLLAILFILVLPNTFAQTTYQYENKIIGFSVVFPCIFTNETPDADPNEEIRMSAKCDDVIYIAGGSVNENVIQDPMTSLELGIEAFNGVLGGEVKKIKKWKCDGVKGLTALIHMTETDMMVEYRSIIRDRRLYQLVYIQTKEEFNKKKAKSFFKTFGFID